MDNKVKIPCGGFYLGDGLTMDGNTLKSLGGEQVQTDWNQNDTTAKDYIKNRPGGYETGFEITWDGDTTGRASVTMEGQSFAWYKVSDTILAPDQFIGSQMTIVLNGEAKQGIITDDMYFEVEFGYVIEIGEPFVLFASKTGDFNMGRNIYIPEPGIYFVYNANSSKTVYVSSLSNIITHPFDDKYIPDTIARKAELDSRITEKEVILTSSTIDSTKKFKITVNDSGTLTATEITK